MSDICTIGRKEIICGFGFLGFDTFEAHSPKEAHDIVRKLKEYKIIFIDPVFFDENFEHQGIIPLPTGEGEDAVERLDNFTIAAAGIKIKDERL